jgi:hypothetical protein
VQTWAMEAGMVGHVPDERPTEYRQFVQAVLDFAVDPVPANVERYLAASRSLEKERFAAPQRSEPRPACGPARIHREEN